MLYRFVSYYATILIVNGIKISLYTSILITLLYTRIQPSSLAVFFYLRNYNDDLNALVIFEKRKTYSLRS